MELILSLHSIVCLSPISLEPSYLIIPFLNDNSTPVVYTGKCVGYEWCTIKVVKKRSLPRFLRISKSSLQDGKLIFTAVVFPEGCSSRSFKYFKFSFHGSFLKASNSADSFCFSSSAYFNYSSALWIAMSFSSFSYLC
jgi:hypothetical protein